jgi:hypothetical protein
MNRLPPFKSEKRSLNSCVKGESFSLLERALIESAGGIVNLGNLLWIVIKIHSHRLLNDPKENVLDAFEVGVGKCHPPHSSAATEK